MRMLYTLQSDEHQLLRQGFAEWLSLTPANAVFSDTNEFWTWLIIPRSL